MGRGPERPIFIPKGAEARLVLEGGVTLLVKNPPSSQFTLEQRVTNNREAQRDILRAEFPDILFPHIKARLTQHGYQVVGGEEVSGEMTVMETNNVLKGWMHRAKTLGISNQEIIRESKQLLQQVTIGASRMGNISAVVKGINTEITGLVDEVWGVKRPQS